MQWKHIVLDFWMSKSNTIALAKTMNRWFLYARDLMNWPLQQFDVDTAAIFIVDLIAWERDIQRFNAEPEWLYRKRVKFAYANARDAGTRAGFKRIWQRMELGEVEIYERMEGEDWDIVQLAVPTRTISDNPELLNIIIEKYGRTCRRYQLHTYVKAEGVISHGRLGCDYHVIAVQSDLVLGSFLTFNGQLVTWNGQEISYRE